MEDSVRTAERQDRDLDPAVIRKRQELFKKYVEPYFNMIYKLTMQYSWNREHVEENYNEVLINFYRGIETYDPSRPLRTWLHIVTKRHVQEMEQRRARYKSHETIDYAGEDIDLDKSSSNPDSSSANLMGIDNYREFYSDEILEVLDQMRPIHRDALLMQEAGYSLKEIADIEYQKGTLKSHNIETVKSRLYLARQFMQSKLTRNGKRKID